MSNDNRYSMCKSKQDDLVSLGTKRYEAFPSVDISTDDATYFVVTATELRRMDLISYKSYGRSDLWWAIALVNKIFNPFTDLYIGQTLVIPAISEVMSAMERERMLLPK